MLEQGKAKNMGISHYKDIYIVIPEFASIFIKDL